MGRRLIADGYIEPNSCGNVTRLDVNLDYRRFLEDDDRRISKSEPARQLVAARVREIELRIARTEHKRCDTEKAIEILQNVVDVYRKEFAGMPRRVGGNPDMQTRIADELNEIYEHVSAVLAKQAQQLRGAAAWAGSSNNE